MSDVDLGQSLIAGFNTGLNIRRNMEETAKLVREREQEEDAKRQSEEMAAEMKPLKERMQLKQAEMFDMLDKQAAGMEVDPKKQALIAQQSARLVQQHFVMTQMQITRAFESGNPILMKQAQEMYNSSSATMLEIGRQQNNAMDRDSRESEGEADRDVRREGFDIQREQLDVQQSEGAEDRKVQRERIDADLKIQGMDDSPASRMKETIFLKDGVAALRAAGMSNEDIDKRMGKGFDSAALEEKWKHLSDETEAELKQAQGVLKRLEERRDGGENVGELIAAQKEEISSLLKEADEVNDSKIRQKSYQRSTPLAKRAASAFMSAIPDFAGAVGRGVMDAAKGVGEASGMRAEDLVPPGKQKGGLATRGSTREFDAPPSDFERPVAYPDEDGNYSVDTDDF